MPVRCGWRFRSSLSAFDHRHTCLSGGSRSTSARLRWARSSEYDHSANFPTRCTAGLASNRCGERRLPCRFFRLRYVKAKKPVITSFAGFESSVGLDWEKPVITSLAGFETAEPVVTEGTAFAGTFRPEPPGVRIAIPADLKYPPAVSRRTPVAASILRRDQPRRPSAITCSCPKQSLHVGGAFC